MKVLLVGLTIVAGAVGAGFGYAGIKTAALPTDMERRSAKSETIDSAQASNGGRFPTGYVPGSATYEDDATDPYEAAAVESDYGEGAVAVSSAELNEMVTEAIASRPNTAPLLGATKDITTALKDGRIESGAKINLSELPLEALPAEGRQVVEQLAQTFPFLANRDVYVGVEGAPKVVDGALSLEDTYVRLGQLRLPIGRVANQLGVSQGEIEQQIGMLLDQQGMSLSDVRIEDGRLVIVE